MNVTLSADSPSTVEYLGSDGNTYRVTVRHFNDGGYTRNASFQTKVGRKWVSAETYEQFTRSLESEIQMAAYAAQERAARKAQKAAQSADPAEPVVLPTATLVSTGETVTVRGYRDGRRGDLLITRADGKKETVTSWALKALLSPADAGTLQVLKAEQAAAEKALKDAKADDVVVNRYHASYEVDKGGQVDVEATFVPETGQFVAQYDGQPFAESMLRDLESRIGQYRAAKMFPFMLVRKADEDDENMRYEVVASTGAGEFMAASRGPLEVLAAAFARQSAASEAHHEFVESLPGFTG